jgi:hypothetical protein
MFSLLSYVIFSKWLQAFLLWNYNRTRPGDTHNLILSYGRDKLGALAQTSGEASHGNWSI